MNTKNSVSASIDGPEINHLNKFIKLFVSSMVASFVCFVLATMFSLSLLGSSPSGFERILATSWLLGTLIIPILMVIRLSHKDKVVNVFKRCIALTLLASVPAGAATWLFVDALMRNLG